MYRNRTDEEANNLCTNAEDCSLWELKYQYNFKFGSNISHFFTSHIISCINNMTIDISKMCRISLSYFLISGADLQYTQWNSCLSKYTRSKAKLK